MKPARTHIAAISIAVAGLLVTAGIAYGVTDGNVSTSKISFSPSTVPKKTYKNGAISTYVATDFKSPGNRALGGYTSRVQLWFDKDFKFNTGTVPACTKDINTNEASAVARCGKSLVGTGTAHVINPKDRSLVPGCVLVFNGPKNSSGQPTLLLHARFSMTDCSSPSTNTGGSTNAILKGTLKPANKAGYGKMLDVPNIDKVPVPLPMADFRAKIKHGSYAQARCSHANRTWHGIGKHTYSDGQSTTQYSTQKCTVG